LTGAHPLPATDEMVRSWVIGKRARDLELLHIAGDAPVESSEADAGDTLDRIENLSDDEVDRLLGKRIRGEA
jgi:hypothetical protein